MDELIAQIQDKTGLTADKAQEVVTIVIGYLRDTLPDGVVDQAMSIALGAAGTASDLAGGLVDKAKGTVGDLLGGTD